MSNLYDSINYMTKEQLKSYLEEQSIENNLYVKLFDKSRTGMSVKACIYVVHEGKIENLTWHINKIILDKIERFIKIHGCGMCKKLILTNNILGLESQKIIEL